MSRYVSKYTGSEIDASIDRALPGGAIDIALQNKAPAGYGLGANSTFVTDFNDAKLPGWYSGDPAVNYPSKIQYGGYGMVFVQGYRNGLITQRWMWQHNTYLPQLTEAIRYYNPDNGFWSEWEYVNPPMRIGVEYRTTERWNGKPVYVIAFDYGPLPNNTVTYTTIPEWVSTNRAFSVNVIAHNPSETCPVPLGLSIDYSSSYWFIQGKAFYIRSRVDLSVYTSCYVYIKYTKE